VLNPVRVVFHRYGIATAESVERDSAEGSFRYSTPPWGLRLSRVGHDHDVVGSGIGSTIVKGVRPRARVLGAGNEQVLSATVTSTANGAEP
jgi:hypothetical protein